MQRTATRLVLAIALTGCRPPTPPVAVAPRTGTEVHASFGRAWDATIDAFAERGISIETLDRASGLIVPAGQTYTSRRDRTEMLTYADCGKSAYGEVVPAGSVKYNVVVRGDSSRSIVLVRAFYHPLPGGVGMCESQGRFERDAEANIKAKAERVGQ